MPMIAFTRILMDRHLGSGAAKGTAAATLALRHPAKAHRAENPIQRKLGWIGGKTPIREAGMVRSKGFLLVSATPPTRSSYHADRDFDAVRTTREAEVRVLALGGWAAPEQRPAMPRRRSEGKGGET